MSEEERSEGIAIIGMAGRFPRAASVDELWQNLQQGLDCVTFYGEEELLARGVPRELLDDPRYVRAALPLAGVEHFAAAFFGFSPKEARAMDPQHRLTLEGAWEALEHAGYDPSRCPGAVGVYLGVGSNTYLLNLLNDPQLARSLGGQMQISNDKDFVPTQVSYQLNLTGPSVNVQTACSTALVAVHLACEALENYRCDLALAGGTRVHVPQDVGYLYQEGGIVSPDGHCRAFDAEARGTVFGNGMGMVVLKRLAEARADGDTIYAVILGSAINNDGGLKVGYTAPSVEGQREVIELALAVAGVEADSISYVETHGTGTPLGDPVEIDALTRAFRAGTERRGFCALGSVKTNVGHLGAAAGAVGLIKTALALKHRQLPASLHFRQANPVIDFAGSPFFVNTELHAWPAGETPRRAGVSSFGIGGTNAHLILEEPPVAEPSGPSRPVQLLVASARSAAAAAAAVERLASHLQDHPELPLADVAFTLQLGRAAFEHRRLLVCRAADGAAGAVAALASQPAETFFAGEVAAGEPGCVFLFPGQGSQYPGMAAQLYRDEAVFRATVDRCAEILRPHLGGDLRAWLYPEGEPGEEDHRQLQQTRLAQPALFVVGYALAELWASWGVRPATMIGHSVGEYVAACVAGVFSLEDALRLVAARGRLMQELPAGAMLAVHLPEAEVLPLLAAGLDLAAVNAPALTVVAGTATAVAELAVRLAAMEVEHRPLRTSHAFHSAMMEPVLQPFAEELRQVQLQPPAIPFLSNLSGQPIRAEEAQDPGYWLRHLRSTVRFADGVGALLAVPNQLFLECGPGRTLATLVRPRLGDAAAGRVLSCLPPAAEAGEDLAAVLTALGRLWLAGVQVDWPALYAGERRRRVALPTYSFERQRYWVERHAGLVPLAGAEPLPELAPVLEPELVAAAGAQEPLNEVEQRIVAIWRQALGVERIGRDDNFFELGGHSLLLVQIGNSFSEAFDIDFPVHLLATAPTVGALAAAIAQLRTEQAGAGRSRSLPPVVPDPDHRFQPFPLTDVQEAYWIGRRGVFQLGQVATHVYHEFELTGLDVERLNRAWQKLVARHEMLRAIVLPDGRQQVLEAVPPYRVQVLDLSFEDEETAQEELAQLRAQISHQVLPADRWPLFDCRVTHLPGERLVLHLSIDMLIADAWSLRLILQELVQFYLRPQLELPPLELTFRDYQLADRQLRQGAAYQRAVEYWRERLPSMPVGPELPLACDPGSIEQPRFVRRRGGLSQAEWQQLCAFATRRGLTASGVLLAAYATILGHWSKSAHFALNLTLFNRLPLHPQVNQVVGDFTSLVLLEADLRRRVAFTEHARALQGQLWRDLEHRYVSGVWMLREMLRRHGGPPRLLVPVVFTSNLNQRVVRQELPAEEAAPEQLPQVNLRESFGISQTPQVWLDHVATDVGGELGYTWDAVEELFPTGLLAEMFDAYGQLLRDLARDETAWQLIPLRLTPEEQLQARALINATAAPLVAGRLQDAFFAQAAAAPAAPAVLAAGGTLSYGELAVRSRRLGWHLHALGVQPNRLVAVVLGKGWQQVAAVLGVLESGAAYLPLDPALPEERRWQLLAQGEVTVVVTSERWRRELSWPAGLQLVDVEAVAAAPSPADTAVRRPLQEPADLAYVIFTSGSTGQPKGVMIDHQAALNTVLDVNQRFAVTAQDRVLALSNLNFDLSVYDIFGLLGAGGAVVMPAPEQAREPEHWAALVAEHRVTLWDTVPALLRMLVDHLEGRGGEQLASLRVALLSGDWIPVNLPNRARALCPQLEVNSLGGATEASIWSICYPVHEVDPAWTSIPYGRPMVNQTFHVLSESLLPRPVWVPGELYIGGAGVARGYWQDPERTAASFLVHPDSGERLYRTGDLGRYLPSGDIEFLGREDFQVKVGGYRIELGEIEAALSQHPEVRDAVVTAVGEARGDRRLIAYVVPRDAGPLALPAATEPAVVPAAISGVYGFVQDPVERLRFKLLELGRLPADDAPVLELGPAGGLPDDLPGEVPPRRSYRHYLPREVPGGALGAWLHCLARSSVDGRPKYRYPSAGSLYPVQVFVYVKSQRVAQVDGGCYYYDPHDHRLRLRGRDELPPEVFTGDNRALFEAAAFALFLVVEMRAVAPLYAGFSRDFALLEAGYMGQLLMMEAARCQLGVCPVGTVEQGLVRPALGLGDSQELIHTLVGGVPDVVRAERADAEDYRLLQELVRREGPASPPALPVAAAVSASAPAAGGPRPVRRLSDRGEMLTALREHLSRRLPEYMVPATLVAIDRLPLTANGKVDRQALPQPDVQHRESPFVAPRNPVEQRVAEIWAEVLELERVGVHDSFFEVGGHSLLAARLTARLREAFATELPLARLFETPTVAGLAEYLAQRTGSGALPDLPPLVLAPAERTRPFPLLELQQAYWVGATSDLELRSVPQYSIELELPELDLAGLQAAVDRLIRRHDVLRLQVLPDGRQQILDQAPACRVERIDLRASADPEAAWQQWREARVARSFDFSHPPLLDVVAAQLGEQRHRLLLRLSLLICDAASFVTFGAELGLFYGSPLAQLPELELSYRDYVLGVRGLRDGELFQRAREYWQERLSALPPAPELPLVRVPASLPESHMVRRAAYLEADAWRSFREQARRVGVTADAALAAVYAEVVAAWSKRRHFCLNLLYFNRLDLHPEVHRLLGNFSTTVLLELDLRPALGFAERARVLQRQLWRDVEHSLYSGIEVLREVNRRHAGDGRRSMPVVFASTLALGTGEGGGQQLGQVVESRIHTPQVWLDHQAHQIGGRLKLNWDSVDELFPPGLPAAMFAAYQDLLARLAASPEAWQQVVRGLVPEEQLHVRAQANATAAAEPAGCLHTLVRQRAAAQPQAPAVIASAGSAVTEELTYAELQQRAWRLAHHLRRRGATRNRLVAVTLERGAAQVAATLGVMEAGAAYLPVSPELPPERRWHLLRHGEVALVVTDARLAGVLEWPPEVELVVLEPLWAEAGEVPAPAAVATPQDLAYVIYTSGSTGLPKGVMIEHRAAVNTLVDVNERGSVGPQDRVLALSALSFDLSVYDFFGILAAGGTVVMPSEEDVREPARWLELVQRHQVTVWDSVPAFMEMFVDHLEGLGRRLPACLRWVLMSGDWIPVTLPDRIRALGSEVAVLSLGGATEGAIWSLCYPIGAVEPSWPSIPYGKPLRRQRFHVLDAALEPCPLWCPGELFIAGAGVATGYWRDPRRTAERFVPHPSTGERLYRTGDLGRYLPDGNLEFLGREDLQLKVRGYRIELGEVEAALVRHPGVRSGAVVAVGERRGPRRLVALYVPGDQGADPGSEAVRQFLADKLPPYMVPQTCLPLAELPLTANGKVDRGELERLAAGGGQQRAVPPRDELERQLAVLWSEVLEIPPPGVTDGFFELGGDSISGVRLMGRIRQRFHRELPLSTLLVEPTIEALAARLRASGGGAAEEVLVAIREVGAGAPFFCIHPVSGSVLCYAELARLCGDDRPFFGVQTATLREEAPASVEAMAAAYLQAVRRRQPQGPYLLGGWSMGGIISFEMARQLEAAGEAARLVVLMDAPPVAAAPAELGDAELAAWFARDLAGLAGVEATLEVHQLRGLEPAVRLQRLASWAAAQGVLPADLDLASLGRHLETFSLNARALARYQPAVCGQPLCLVETAQGDGSWQRWTRQLVTRQVVPGNHYTMMRAPHVSRLAEVLRAVLAAADALPR